METWGEDLPSSEVDHVARKHQGHKQRSPRSSAMSTALIQATSASRARKAPSVGPLADEPRFAPTLTPPSVAAGAKGRAELQEAGGAGMEGCLVRMFEQSAVLQSCSNDCFLRFFARRGLLPKSRFRKRLTVA